MELFAAAGPAVVEPLAARGHSMFLDLTSTALEDVADLPRLLAVRSLSVLALPRVLHSACVISYARRTLPPTRYISIRAPSTDDSRRR